MNKLKSAVLYEYLTKVTILPYIAVFTDSVMFLQIGYGLLFYI